MGENFYRSVAGDATFFCQQNAFGESHHLGGKIQVDRDLQDKGQAVIADIGHLGPDVLQDRLHALESFAASGNHHRKFAFLQRDDAAGDRGVEHVGALFPNFGGERAADIRADGADVDEDLARRETGQQSVRTFHDGGQGG